MARPWHFFHFPTVNRGWSDHHLHFIRMNFQVCFPKNGMNSWVFSIPSWEGSNISPENIHFEWMIFRTSRGQGRKVVDVNSDPTFPQLPTEEDLGKIGICYTYLGFWEGRGARTIFFSKKPGMKTEGPTFSLDWRDAYGWWWMLSENHSQHMDIYIYIYIFCIYYK